VCCGCLSLVVTQPVRHLHHCIKLKFNGTDTDTDFLANFRTRIHARKSDSRFSSQGCPFGMRACTHVLYVGKLLCTRLQNYTIGTSLMSVSVSVPWNFKLHCTWQPVGYPSHPTCLAFFFRWWHGSVTLLQEMLLRLSSCCITKSNLNYLFF